MSSAAARYAHQPCSYQVRWGTERPDPSLRWVLCGAWGELEVRRPGLEHRMAQAATWQERRRLRTAGRPMPHAEDWEEYGTDMKSWKATKPDWKK